MSNRVHLNLTRRERQIMDVIYSRGQATVAEVLEEMPDPPGYSAVRAMLRKLEAKGHLRHAEEGPRYVYIATVPRHQARQSAIDRLVQTFFGGSVTKAAAALLDHAAASTGEDELRELADRIERARKEGR